jgi:hypothetical protein
VLAELWIVQMCVVVVKCWVNVVCCCGEMLGKYGVWCVVGVKCWLNVVCGVWLW